MKKIQCALLSVLCFSACTKPNQTTLTEEIELDKNEQLSVLYTGGVISIKQNGVSIVSVSFANLNRNGKIGRTVTTFDDFERGDGIEYERGSIGAVNSSRRIKNNSDELEVLYNSDGKIDGIFNLSKKHHISVDEFLNRR